MKTKLFFLLCFFCFSLFIKATVLIVDNNTTNPGHYTTINAAIQAANIAGGDIIYVLGSPTSYGNCKIDRPLKLIGAGYYNQNQYDLTTSVGAIVINKNISNVTISGINISSITSKGKTQNIHINRCQVSITLSNDDQLWAIDQNIIGGINLGIAKNIVISNNIVRGMISGGNPVNSATGVLIDHNVFIVPDQAFYNVKYATITNNVVYKSQVAGLDYCQCNNNCTYDPNLNYARSFNYGNNTAFNNYEGINPLFNNIGGSNFSYLYDYKVTNADLVSSDGSGDVIGISTGQYAWTPHVPPAIPQIVTLTINNPIVPINGTLNINAHVKSQD